jgi:hypothetical protein
VNFSSMALTLSLPAHAAGVSEHLRGGPSQTCAGGSADLPVSGMQTGGGLTQAPTVGPSQGRYKLSSKPSLQTTSAAEK